MKKENKSNEWFYSDIVKDHFFNPRNIMKEGEMKDADGVGTVGSPKCLAPEVKVESFLSIDPIKNLKKGDLVQTHLGREQKIIRTFNRSYKGKILVLKNQFGKVKITPEHLVYAIKVPNKSKFAHNSYKKKLIPAWYHALDLKKGDIIIYPKPFIPESSKSIYISREQKKYDFSSHKIKCNFRLNKDIMRFFGYFFAEGNTRPNNHEICLSFHEKEEEYINDVKNIIKKIFNLEVFIKTDKVHKLSKVSIYNVYLSRFLRNNFGTNAINKRIPNFIFNTKPFLQKEFIKGLWYGDGYVNFNRKNQRAGYSTISSLLINQLKLLLLNQGILPSVYSESEKVINGVKHKKCYRIHVGNKESLEKLAQILNIPLKYRIDKNIKIHSWMNDKFVYLPLRSIKISNYNGKVYNLEVEKDHSFTTTSFLLHNCGDVMKMWIKIKNNKITDCKWKTFGCASAIASTSMLSTMVLENGGMTIEQAMKITPKDIINRLGGLPEVKVHCSVLGDQALRAAIKDYQEKKKV